MLNGLGKIENGSVFTKERLLAASMKKETVYSGTSDKGPSEIGMTSLQRTLVA